jgi:hypothetical protein
MKLFHLALPKTHPAIYEQIERGERPGLSRGDARRSSRLSSTCAAKRRPSAVAGAKGLVDLRQSMIQFLADAWSLSRPPSLAQEAMPSVDLRRQAPQMASADRRGGAGVVPARRRRLDERVLPLLAGSRARRAWVSIFPASCPRWHGRTCSPARRPRAASPSGSTGSTPGCCCCCETAQMAAHRHAGHGRCRRGAAGLPGGDATSAHSELGQFQLTRRVLEAARAPCPRSSIALIFVWAFGVGRAGGHPRHLRCTPRARSGKLFSRTRWRMRSCGPGTACAPRAAPGSQACRFAVLPAADAGPA